MFSSGQKNHSRICWSPCPPNWSYSPDMPGNRACWTNFRPNSCPVNWWQFWRTRCHEWPAAVCGRECSGRTLGRVCHQTKVECRAKLRTSFEIISICDPIWCSTGSDLRISDQTVNFNQLWRRHNLVFSYPLSFIQVDFGVEQLVVVQILNFRAVHNFIKYRSIADETLTFDGNLIKNSSMKPTTKIIKSMLTSGV